MCERQQSSLSWQDSQGGDDTAELSSQEEEEEGVAFYVYVNVC